MAASSLFTDGLFEVEEGEEPGASLQEVLDAIEALGATASITVISAIDGDNITVYRNDTWSFSAEVTFALTAYEAVAFIVKKDQGIADAAATLYVRSDTGLQAIAGAVAADATKGSLTVDNATEFSVLVSMTATNTIPDAYTWWLKVFDTTATPDEGYTRATGKFMIKDYGLRATA